MLNNRFGFVRLATFLIAASAMTTPVRAVAPDPAATFSSHNFVPVGAAGTSGYSFNVVFPVSVVGLSTIDDGGNGLAVSHDVGLWESSGTLLAGTTVLAGTASPLDSSGLYRYEPITPLVLPVGSGYTVGSWDNGFNDQVSIFGTPTMAAGLTFGGGSFAYGASLTRPDILIGWTAGNFVVVVPEPASLGLLATGAGMMLRRRRTVQPA